MLLPALMLAAQFGPPGYGKGSQLYAQCKKYVSVTEQGSVNSQVAFDGGSCAGYISAMSDTLMTNHAFCPTNTTNGTLVRVYIAYIDKNPKMLDESRGNGVVAAFEDAFPCAK